jgi:hypothetical protein
LHFRRTIPFSRISEATASSSQGRTSAFVIHVAEGTFLRIDDLAKHLEPRRLFEKEPTVRLEELGA